MRAPARGNALALTSGQLGWVAAGVFVLLDICPGCRAVCEHAGDPLLAGWHDVLRDRGLVLFAVACSGQLAAFSQLYLLLPLEVQRASGSQQPLGWLSALSALLVIVGGCA